MEWQPRSWHELICEWPYASMVLTMSTVLRNMKQTRKEMEAKSKGERTPEEQEELQRELEARRSADGVEIEEG